MYMDLARKIRPPLLRGLKPAIFDYESGALSTELSPTLCLAESCCCAHSLRRSAFGVPQSAFAEAMLCTQRKSTIGIPQTVLAVDMLMYTLYGDLPWVHHACACVLCLQWTYRN